MHKREDPYEPKTRVRGHLALCDRHGAFPRGVHTSRGAELYARQRASGLQPNRPCKLVQPSRDGRSDRERRADLGPRAHRRAQDASLRQRRAGDQPEQLPGGHCRRQRPRPLCAWTSRTHSGSFAACSPGAGHEKAGCHPRPARGPFLRSAREAPADRGTMMPLTSRPSGWVARCPVRVDLDFARL